VVTLGRFTLLDVEELEDGLHAGDRCGGGEGGVSLLPATNQNEGTCVVLATAGWGTRYPSRTLSLVKLLKKTKTDANLNLDV